MGARGLGGWVSWVKMGVGGFVVECREECCFGDDEGGEGRKINGDTGSVGFALAG